MICKTNTILQKNTMIIIYIEKKILYLYYIKKINYLKYKC